MEANTGLSYISFYVIISAVEKIIQIFSIITDNTISSSVSD